MIFPEKHEYFLPSIGHLSIRTYLVTGPAIINDFNELTKAYDRKVRPPVLRECYLTSNSMQEIHGFGIKLWRNLVVFRILD